MTAAADGAAPESPRYASRKFLLAVATVVAGHVALWTRSIDASQWVDLMRWTVGLYCAGNVGAWAVDALRAGLAQRP